MNTNCSSELDVSSMLNTLPGFESQADTKLPRIKGGNVDLRWCGWRIKVFEAFKIGSSMNELMDTYTDLCPYRDLFTQLWK